MKQQLGQFFTTNTNYVLDGFNDLVIDKRITDPFAGGGDLLAWAKKCNAKSVMGFDIDERFVDERIIFLNDSFANPQKYDFILTNPPYLYQNKLSNNTILATSKHTDLYQLALEKIMDSSEGIVIVPINFLSAENSKYIRKIFLDKFEIIKVNYFTNQAFDDTTYNVMSFYYQKKDKKIDSMKIEMKILPENLSLTFELFEKYDWQIGGEFLAMINKFQNKLKLKRLEEKDLISGKFSIKAGYNHLSKVKNFNVDEKTYHLIKNNIITLKAIDTGSNSGKISLEDIRTYSLDALVSIPTSRNQIYLIFPNDISISTQENLIKQFNQKLEEKREQYFSLFMTNYRDKNRKRISFNFAYNFLNYLYFNMRRDVITG